MSWRSTPGVVASSMGSITRSVRASGARFPRPSLPVTSPSGVPAALSASSQRAPSALVPAVPSTLPAITDSPTSAPQQPHPASLLLADLARAGKVASETLKVVEQSGAWRDYESHVNFEVNMLRLRYSSTPDVPNSTARRTQLGAHVRAKQAEVMAEHATAAAREFVESLSAREVAELRALVSRLDAPGSGASVAPGELEAERAVAVTAEELRDALWSVSTELAKAKGGRKNR